MPAGYWTQFFKAQFHYSKFGFAHKDWRAFTFSPWLPQTSKHQLIYLIYRWLVAIYFFGWLIAVGAISKYGGKFFIYLTYWNFLLVVAHLLYSAVCCTYAHFKFAFRSAESHHKSELKQEDLYDPPHCIKKCCLCFQCCEPEQVSWYYLPLWIGHYIATILPIPVIVFYWGLLYAGSDGNVNWATNLHSHLLIGLPGIIDVLFSGIPWRLYHVYVSIICGIAYLIFSLVYDMSGGTNAHGDPYIYPGTDYSESPASAIGLVVIVGFIFCPFVHFIFWCIYIVRTLILYCKIGGGHQTSGIETDEYRTRKISQQPLSPGAGDDGDAVVKGKRNRLDFEMDDQSPNTGRSPVVKDTIGEENPLFFVDEQPPQSPQ